MSLVYTAQTAAPETVEKKYSNELPQCDATPAPGNACGCPCGRGQIVEQKSISIGQIVTFIILLLVFWPVCWIPFVTSGCRDTTQKCINCGRTLNVEHGCLC